MFLCFFLVIEERLDDVCLCGRQKLRSYKQRFRMSLKRLQLYQGYPLWCR